MNNIESILKNIANNHTTEKIREFNKHLLALRSEFMDFQLVSSLIISVIPEWKRLIGCKQHLTHDFTLDNHTLLVIKKILDSKEYSDLVKYDKLVLLYSAILHDIEKAEGQVDHSHPEKGAKQSCKILNNLGFNDNFIADVCNIIFNHQILGRIAIDQIIFEPEVLKNRVKTYRMLCLLAIFSIADIKSVKKDEGFFKDSIGIKITKLVDEMKSYFE